MRRTIAVVPLGSQLATTLVNYVGPNLRGAYDPNDFINMLGPGVYQVYECKPMDVREALKNGGPMAALAELQLVKLLDILVVPDEDEPGEEDPGGDDLGH